MATDIKSKIDALSGTTTMSRNITEALDKYTGSEKMSRNIAEAAAKMEGKEPSPTPEPEPEPDPEPEYTYILTEDIEVDFTKTYYQMLGTDYIAVEEPTGDPHAQGWYERVSA